MPNLGIQIKASYSTFASRDIQTLTGCGFSDEKSRLARRCQKLFLDWFLAIEAMRRLKQCQRF